MTKKEVCEKIIKHDGCINIHCVDCPGMDDNKLCFWNGLDGCVEHATKWLSENCEDEFQKGEIILVRGDETSEWIERIFIEEKFGIYYCVTVGNTFEESKENFKSNHFNLWPFSHAKKLNGEIVTADKKDDTILIEKSKVRYIFSKDNHEIYLEIDYFAKNYTLLNWHDVEEFIFKKTSNMDQNIIVLELMLEATKYAKKELSQEEI